MLDTFREEMETDKKWDTMIGNPYKAELSSLMIAGSTQDKRLGLFLE